MFRAVSVRLRSFGPSRAIATLFAALLLVTIEGIVPSAVEGKSTFGRHVIATRQAQVRAAARMRQADHKLKAIRRQRRIDARKRSRSATRARAARERRQRARRRMARAESRLEIARLDLDRRLRVRPNPLRFHQADTQRARKSLKRLRKDTRRIMRKDGRIERKASRIIRHHVQRKRRQGRYRARIEAKIREREAAEARLAIRIERMLDLARARAERSRRVSPVRGKLKRPSRGYVSQRFGCTRTRTSKGGRSCARYHDGVDIATSRGSIVRASADGVVAFVGFNPWDRRKRAYIVMIAHRGGLVTIYAHLRPIRRVKAGQVVRRGQTIGFAGVTGHTTGPHVHWEAVRQGRRIDPFGVR